MRSALLATLAASALVLTACGSEGGDTADPSTSPPRSAATSASDTAEPETATEPSSSPDLPDSPATARPPDSDPGTVITTGGSEFGPMLFDENDQAIYMWEREPTSKPTCYGDCADAWPPVLTDGEPVAAGKVKPRLLGTTKRRGGQIQVTYGGHPLYYYVDEGPGEVLCHNVATHGGLWWVVQPDGDPAP
ncbi:putative lipoprotein with Yx(FWY)xxD motif [Mumia flava]|uniref:Putative lipoprotein with Yx(FWY)xxD motif n=1 Tax=Mumia flava TaxID=1348852 RepID=A0A0B2B3U4_9ACTN|nr:hypothetical protein [Mumia flava]PJJ53528.1 putative lipoprotein with Yx(FWY)xxD motif [Mumia flava]